ncbi:hypothetical protein [Paracoccus sp. S3-43]|uniref:hypothetical protein n=1 Tax=Paracoccus sp. S3-43 TaxID=3030011 RepID=UPI0023B083E3|nr:hypothetical protein [Paracoccus sp. S3-43]WEF23972.1 hypothetical protein PXD02_14465 [Paracoccus sp. S3-43]
MATILVSAGTFFFTKKAERSAVWRSKKLAYYEEFFGAASGIVGDATPIEAKMRFATSVNNLHLVGSPGVIKSLHQFIDEIAVSNDNRTQSKHDELWSALVWEIRADLNDPPSKDPLTFSARLWASGVGRNS